MSRKLTKLNADLNWHQFTDSPGRIPLPLPGLHFLHFTSEKVGLDQGWKIITSHRSAPVELALC